MPDDAPRPLRTSPSIATIAAALAKAQAAFRPVTKDKTAEFQTRTGGKVHYAYTDLASVIDAVRPALADQELALVQAVRVRQSVVSVETTLLHASGEWIASELDLLVAEAMDPRSVGSAITYARRFSLTALVGLAPAEGEDDDAAAAVPTPKPRRSSAARRDTSPETPPALAPTMAPDRPRLNEKQRRLLFATARDHGWRDDELRAEILDKFGYDSTHQLQREDLDQLLNLLQRRPRVPKPSPPTTARHEDPF
jgi:hypothetical protein